MFAVSLNVERVDLINIKRLFLVVVVVFGRIEIIIFATSSFLFYIFLIFSALYMSKLEIVFYFFFPK